MNILLMLASMSQADVFETVTAAIIVTLTLIVLFFLYRNVAYEIRDIRERKQALQEKLDFNEVDENDDSYLFVDPNEDIKGTILTNRINHIIENANDGDLGALYYINLDDFRNIVEDYDQKHIDKLIKELEKKLQKYCGKKGISGNYLEDIFLYYYNEKVDAEIMKNIGQELLDLIQSPLKSISETLTASIGLSVFPYDGINADQLIKNAEVAAYVAKKEGKNRFRMFSEDLIDTEQLNVNYYQEIKRSIKNDEFLLYYQTIVDIKTGRIIGLESLLRWDHPTMGLLPPSRFLNVMELTGDITWFGTWGFEKNVLQYKKWVSKIKIRDLFISINLSKKQLEVENLPEQFFKITKKYGLSPELFSLEIIDFYSLIKSKQALRNLAEFRKYGFRIAIDDVGPDFRIIQDMPNINAGIFKLPRNLTNKLIAEKESRKELEKVISKAQEFSKIVIAEGIENEMMIKTMYQNGVRFMQGYYFNEPESIDKIEIMLENSPWDMSSFTHLMYKEEQKN